MRLWLPDRILFEEDALQYPLGQAIYARYKDQTATGIIPSHNRITGLPGHSPRQKYAAAKQTLAVGVRRTLTFQPSKPSADYALPLLTGCPGHCEYCYLQTTLGPRPVVRVYVNVDAILAQADRYMAERAPALTTFEAACTSDPLAVEHITGLMGRAAAHFGAAPLGRLRLVSKYTTIDSLLEAEHRGHTEVRFSLNTAAVITRWELGTAPLAARVAAAARLARAGYRVGFLIAPIFLEGDWQQAYGSLLDTTLATWLAAQGPPDQALTFELITHRFTPKAKALIKERFPTTELPLQEATRRWKYGQFGYGKYLYPAEQLQAARDFFAAAVAARFPHARVLYLV